MSSMFGHKIRLSIFGQSHGEKIGMVLDGLPAGEKVDLDALKAFMARRAPGQRLTTQRRETDEPHLVSGVTDGVTCGAPLCALIDNEDTRPGDYEALRFVPRPGHADYPAFVKYGGMNDVRGGGHFSARLTAPLCAAGGILMQLYARRGIRIGAHLIAVHDVWDASFDPLNVTEDELYKAQKNDFPTLDAQAGEKMRLEIEKARAEGDSVGGVVECAVLGLRAGLGEPMFGGLENEIAAAVFAVPAVKGIEFGEGFRAAALRGTQNNDAYAVSGGAPSLLSNHAGGVLGGLSSGAPLVFRAAFKPTPSVSRPQQSVNLRTNTDETLVIRGRHDPCVAVRAVPCVEAAAAVALADFIL